MHEEGRGVEHEEHELGENCLSMFYYLPITQNIGVASKKLKIWF